MKQTECKNYGVCGNKFFQYSSLDTLCYKCKKEKFNAKVKPEKAVNHFKRKSARTEEQRKRQSCDYYWSQIIKIANPFCWFTGCNKPSTEACHIHSRRHDGTRWDVKNGMGGCRQHHRWETDHPKEAKPLVMAHVGKEEYERLRQISLKSVHYCLPDYVEMEHKLKKTLDYYLKKQ